MQQGPLEPSNVFIGTAGWSVPRAAAAQIPGTGSHLERYARIFTGAEINSTFKHEHRVSTWERWAASTPPGFRFSVKLPHEITHRSRLEGVAEALLRFLGSVTPLGERLGPLLLQLPGTLTLEPRPVGAFFDLLRRHFDGAVVCEPRHADWFTPTAETLYAHYRVGRVGADPQRVPGAGRPGGWLGDASRRGIAYFRWHGAPVVYRSSYPPEQLARWAEELQPWRARCDCWCIFDNTASGAAAQNALDLLSCLADAGAAQ